MVRDMKGSILKERSRVKATSSGLMGATIQENLETITLRGMASTIGWMDADSLVSGKKIRCMAEVCLLGLMVVYTMESIKETRNMAGVSSAGLMADATQDTGHMESSMVKELI